MFEHALSRHLSLDRTLRVLVVGAGGTGSKVVVGLKNLHLALRAFGRPGLHVTLADGDIVSEANLARQAFYPSDLGRNKAHVLIHRLNLSCGLDWNAHPEHLDRNARFTRERPQLLVSCVDSKEARATVEYLTDLHEVLYICDFGNTDRRGQVVLGQPLNRYTPRSRERLRTAFELFPELTDTVLPEDDAPSCSALESLLKQDLFVNDQLVVSGLNVLWQLLRFGSIGHHGAFVDVASGAVQPLRVDPDLWRTLRRQNTRHLARKRMNYHAH